MVGLCADWIGIPSEPGVGGLQLGLLGLGLAIALWGALGTRPRARLLVARAYAMVLSIYLALWGAELVLTYGLDPARDFKPHALSLPGMYEVGDQVAYRHVAGYTGTFDDGVLQIPIRINSRGDRDDEPRSEHPAERRILLVGDSFTFGQGLTDEQKIDRRIEHYSDDEVDAYTLGVMGYGPSNSLRRLKESSWWTGRAIYYLFFANDLADTDARADYYAVHEGFVVRRFRSDGERYTPEQWTALLHAVRERSVHRKGRLRLSFTLPSLRKIAYQVTHENTRLTGIPDALVKPTNIDAAVDITTSMLALARERGAMFTVVLIPAVGEAKAGKYSDWGRAYIDGITAQGIDVLDILDRLDGEGYFAHDPHFDPEGADVMARAILEHFEQSLSSP
ncbi:MAG: hypothetical protein AAGF11_51045 [Myxococcota bacterium]